jgi:hypothetical protein
MTISSILSHKIETVVKYVDQLNSAGGRDSDAILKIRSIVTNELMGGGSLDVITGAIGQIESDSAVKRFLEVVDYCSEHFLVDDRILSAVVLPVSIRVRGLTDSPLRISKANRDPLKEMAKRLTEALGARNVVIDSWLYTPQSLSYFNVPKLRAYLMKLEEGALYPTGGLSALQIFAESDVRWRLAYLIGVEVIEAGKSPKLHDGPVQLQSTRWLDLPSAAIEMSDEVHLHERAQVQAVCHGVSYLMRGLDVGVKGQRSMEIVDMLESMGPTGRGLKIFCAQDIFGSKVRTFLVSQAMAIEGKWNLLGQESLWDFRHCLAILAHRVLSGFDDCCISLVTEETYSDIVKGRVPDFRNPRAPT